MDNAKFVKFAKDTKLIHKRGRLTTTDCDLIFNKVGFVLCAVRAPQASLEFTKRSLPTYCPQVKQKGKRKIGFAEFETALSMIGAWRDYDNVCVWCVAA